MYRSSPRRFAVYPDYDGYIAIDARDRNDSIAAVLCGSAGGVLCLAVIDQNPGGPGMLRPSAGLTASCARRCWAWERNRRPEK